MKQRFSDTGKQEVQTMMPKEKGNKWGELSNWSASAWRQFLGHWAGREQNKVSREPSNLKFRRQKSCRARWLNMCNRALKWRGLPKTEEAPEICRVPSNLWLNTDMHMWEKNSPSPGKKHQKGCRQNNSWSSHRSRISSCSHQPRWKDLLTPGVSCKVLRKILSQ